jgi:Mg-chelatase subunit ChlD
MKGHVFKSAVETILRKISSHSHLRIRRIEWSNVPTACVSSNYVVELADVADDAVFSQAFLERYVGFVVHELCHVKYTDFSANGSDPYLKQLHNAVEDIWIERKAIKSNNLGNIESIFTKLINQIIAEGEGEGIDWADPAQYPFALACVGRRYARPIPLAKGLEEIFQHASDRVDSANSSYDTLKIAEWVYEQLMNLPEQSESKPKPTPSKGAEDGSEPSTGDQNGEGEGEGADATENGSETATRPVRGQQAREVEPTLEVPKGKEGIGSYSKDMGLRSDQYHTGSHDRIIDVNVPSKLRHEVRMLFENSGLDEFQMGRKSGKINTSALPSISTGNVHVFKRHHEDGGISSAVSIILDASSSMDYNNKAQLAVETAYALYETLSQAGVAVQVLTFDNFTSLLVPFNTPVAKAKTIMKKFKTNGSTNDYFAIRYAHEQLLNRPESRKVTFVLTDGRGNVDAVKKQIESGNRMGITTVGVGIGIDVSFVYDKHVNIMQIRELATASFKQIKLVA